MKSIMAVLFVFVAIAVVGSSLGAMLITENAGLVSAALTDLKFEAIPGNPKMIGAPPQLKISKATIEYLTKLQKDGKIVEVENNGSLKIK